MLNGLEEEEKEEEEEKGMVSGWGAPDNPK